MQHLDRDLLLHASVVAFAAIDHPHAAAADFLEQVEGAEPRTDRRWHRRGGQRCDGRVGAIGPLPVRGEHRCERVGDARIFGTMRGDESRGSGGIERFGLIEQRLESLPLQSGKRAVHENLP